MKALSEIGNPGRHRFLSWAVAVCLCGAALIAYGPATRFGFVNYDDPLYVSENANTQAGFTPTSIAWALTQAHASNWHPVTWFSHMLDCQLFGLAPAGHHWTSVLLHLANTILLFLVLKELTGQLWPSALASFWFGLHPAHVESVAWIAERKDVLSGFFALSAIWAYARSARNEASGTARRWTWYWGAVFLYLLGLLSKPMLVTFPCLLLLLDYWPLNRFHGASGERKGNLRFLLYEKLPFLLLALACGAMTLWAQHQGGSVIGLEAFPLSHRFANSLLSYWRYVGMLLWPAHLAVFYPYAGRPPLWLTILAGAGLVLATVGVIRIRKLPWLTVGWLWFLVSLLPVIGLVQVGLQAMADWYTYLPSVGLFIALAFSLNAAATRIRFGGWGVAALGTATAVACLFATAKQVPYWKDSVTLFRHATEVTTGNYIAYNNLGTGLQKAGQLQAAGECYRRSLLIRSDQDQAFDNLGQLLMLQGQLDDAQTCLLQALRQNPKSASAYYNLGTLLLSKGDVDGALGAFQSAVSLRADWPEAHNNLGGLLGAKGRWDDAIREFQCALRFQPDSINALSNLGSALVEKGRAKEALDPLLKAIRIDAKFANAHYSLGNAYANLNQLAEARREYLKALELNPHDNLFHYKLGNLLWRQKETQGAAQEYRAALSANPNHAESHYQLAVVHEAQNSPTQAIPHFRDAIRLRPAWVEPLNNLAWLLATCANEQCRDGPEAVRLATQATTLTRQTDPETLDTLAAALAEAGQFEEAEKTAGRAAELARTAAQTGLAAEIEQRRQLYQHHQPYRK